MQRKTFISLLFLVIIMLITSCSRNNVPISLHPDNPHYFLFRGQPTILIGSTEHYGAVLNLDFDYIPYLDELASHNLNVTRTFSGIYLEPQGAFGIVNNTLAPAEDKLICPWARSKQPGYANGGNKFDLNEWDEAYFKRLEDFISEAGKRNIVVELDLFSNFYDTIQWKLSPLYIDNNINQIGNMVDHKEILSLKHPEILAVQEKMVRKIIETLQEYDNLYYEVCNEPYFGDLEALESWEHYMTSVIADAEKNFSVQHLISQNIANDFQRIENPNPLVSIFNFHYAKPPVTIEMNFNINKVIGDNETGFDGIEDVNYRTEAWEFLTAGGGLFNNLDYSFTVDHEDGSFRIPAEQPGGGGKKFRSQLSILRQVFQEIDFISMKPSNSILQDKPGDIARTWALAGEGQYLVYLNSSVENVSANPDSLHSPGNEVIHLTLKLPAGWYSVSWINTLTGERTKREIEVMQPGTVKLETPPFSEDIALLIRKK